MSRGESNDSESGRNLGGSREKGGLLIPFLRHTEVLVSRFPWSGTFVKIGIPWPQVTAPFVSVCRVPSAWRSTRLARVWCPATGECEGAEIESVRVNRRTSGLRQTICQSPTREVGGAQWMHHMRGHGVARERRAVDHEHTVTLPGQEHRRRRTAQRAPTMIASDDRVIGSIHVCPS